ncbi:MAG: excalibur calcium-binding domain-containing protein [Cyanobacteriota bacterium]|nr:excalibur calcium-binding domain-containing protein [Cyanobacteriota bacterium]
MRLAIGIALFAGTLGVSVVAQTTNAPRNSNLPACVDRDCNCSDFNTWQEAQQVFEAYQGDPFDLDRDRDNVPCENLLGASFDNTAPLTTNPGNTNVPPARPNSNSPTNTAPIRALW